MAAWSTDGAGRVILRPVSRRAGRFIRQCHRNFVRVVRAARRNRCICSFRVDIRPELERAGHWHVTRLYSISRSISRPSGWPFAGILGLLAPPHADEPAPNAQRPDCHRLPSLSGGLSYRSCVEQHPGFRVMKPCIQSASSHLFTGQRSRDPLRVVLAQARSRAFHRFSIVRRCPLGTHHSRDVVAPRWHSLLLRCTGTVGPQRRRTRGADFRPRCRAYPGRWTRRFWPDGCGWFPRWQCSRASISHCLGFDFSHECLLLAFIHQLSDWIHQVRCPLSGV